MNSLIGIHIWEALGRCLAPLFVTDTGPHEPPSVAPPPCPEAAATDSIFRSTDGVFKWVQPDISEGSPWHLDRVYKLVDACKALPDRMERVLEGLEALKRHRANYGPNGIQYLQILWWEWPCERWSELRNGCEMNFLVEPRSNLDKPDPVLDETQSGVADEFVGELCALGTLGLPPTQKDIRAITPLFLLPKPGQVDQWRVLGDMKKGG